MTFLILIASVVGIVWCSIFLLRGSLVSGCLGFLLAACCFSHTFLQFDLGPIPLTLDRLVLVVLVAAYLFQRKLGRADPKPMSAVDWLVAAFALVLVASTFASDWRIERPRQISPVWRLVFAYLMPATVYWIARQAPLTAGRIQTVMSALAGFGVYLALTGLAEVAGQWSLVFPSYIADPKVGIHFGRARGPMVQAACYGTTLVICMLAAWTWRERLGRAGQLLVVLLMPLYLAGIYSSYTRSAWLGAAVGLVIALALTLRGVWRAGMLGSLLAAGLLVAVVNWEGIVGFKREQSAEETRKSAQMRGSFAYASWKMFLDRPLLGCGFGQYQTEVLPYLSDRSTELDLESIRGYVHHNTLLCILVENGAVGLLLFLGMLFGWGRAAWRLWRSDDPCDVTRMLGVLMLSTLAVYVLQALSHDVTYTAIENMLLFFLAGLTVGLRQMALRDQGANRTAPVARRALSTGRAAAYGR
jgi:O-antigen ligase